MALQPCRAHLPRARHTLRALTSSLRTYATESTTPDSFKVSSAQTDSPVPRWSQTPAGMKAPMQLDFAKSFKNKIWNVNNDPAKLDEMYNRLLGPGGSKMLPEELKWLAVTHKSFDQGRRGFNDKLALMGTFFFCCVSLFDVGGGGTDWVFFTGRLAVAMEATKEIVSKSPLKGSRQTDEFDRVPFEHEQLAAVDNLNVEGPKDVVGKEQLYALASSVGVLDVLRWKPRLVGFFHLLPIDEIFLCVYEY